MKINFNDKSSNTYRKYDYYTPLWVKELLNQFYKAYDIDIASSDLHKLYSTTSGSRDFCKWLIEAGFKANYWETETTINGVPFAYGVDIADDCPTFVEFKLKQTEFGTY